MRTIQKKTKNNELKNINRKNPEEIVIVKGKERAFSATLCYKLKNKASTHSIPEINGKFECPICTDKIKNVQIHLEKKIRCGQKIDLEHFITNHAEFKKQKWNYQNQTKVQKAQEKAKCENKESFDNKNKEAARKSKEKSKCEDKEFFDDKNKEAARKSKAKSKCEDKNLLIIKIMKLPGNHKQS